MTELKLLVSMGDECDWQESAFCRQVDPCLWHAEDGTGTATARRLCVQHCPVMKECLTQALRDREEWGVWGGASPKQRRAVFNGNATPESLLSCKRGHRFSAENTLFDRMGRKRCRPCDADATRQRREVGAA